MIKRAIALAVGTVIVALSTAIPRSVPLERSIERQKSVEKVSDDNFTTETTEAVKVAFFDVTEPIDFSGIALDLEGGWYELAADEEEQTETCGGDCESVAQSDETGENLEPVRDCDVPAEPSPEAEGTPVPAEPQARSQVSPVSEQSRYPLYTVDGAMLPEYLQAYLYERLSQYGITWFYHYALCQIYQESRFDPAAVSYDGKDHGLCQFRERFFADYATQAGLYTWDINNPIDQLYVYTWLMARNLSATNGDIGWALSMYYMGEAIYCERYVADVLQWESTVRSI